MSEISYSNIGEVDKFSADDYPAMVAELTMMVGDINKAPHHHRKDIVVAYLKDHAVKLEWTNANPALVKLMESGSLSTLHLEKLFEGCRWNKGFRTDFERYIKGKIN